ncbi:PIN domain-containing protein [Algiphilus sp. W345]|uniref:Ribonuclease VapC n=1 Tax=Banduia mediterranea TaxID=3075609 RepID=A0ABU2WH65_9GAMM|nr:PIN domain-containing protein [Algiphilus sp. W345]MDT0496873.1 PIN domain-containing protein [Algiphilus sp. W345]
MAALYLLDTSIVIAAMKGIPPVRHRLESLPLESLRLSAIVLGELAFGAEKSAHGERNRSRPAELAGRLPLVGIDHETIRHYAEVRASLERLGTPIGANDTWIAAQALATGAVLVTDNEREFRRIKALQLENWLERGPAASG